MPPTKKSPRERKYEIAPPLAYKAFSAAVPPEVPERKVPEALAVRKEAAPPPRKRAVWIVHGMGQQIPFETLDSLTEGLTGVAQPPPGAADITPRYRSVKIDDQIFQRVELDVSRNGVPYELHLYEAYWAPVTEGALKLRDVMGFLFDGSLRGLFNSLKEFERAIFGRIVNFKIPKRAAAEVSLALLTLLSLMVINAVILAAGAAKYALPGYKTSIPAENWEQLTAIASALSVVALAFGAILFLAELCKPPELPGWGKKIVCTLTWITFALTLAAIILGAAFLGLRATGITTAFSLPEGRATSIQGFSTFVALVVGALVALALRTRASKRSAGLTMRDPVQFIPYFVLSFLLFLSASFGPVVISVCDLHAPARFEAIAGWLASPWWVWPFLIAVGYQVRTLLVQYVGDVAAYIGANKLDRFAEIRRRIKEIAKKSATAVYLARTGDDFLYEKVAVVGHSLGSVIAYDALNGLLNEDTLSGDRLRVADRTCLLETFGSPLDKIAFFFTIQGKSTLHVREQLAAVVQPLIQSYPQYRRFPWVNVYSPNDIISGPVRLYDDLNDPARTNPVEAVADPDAIVPLVAHVEYWRNPLIWQRLYQAITTP